MSELKPLCFVLMPFGEKPDPAGGRPIPFDRVYEAAIEPAIADAGLAPVRADRESPGGIIHRAMFLRLMLCRYAIADLTTANANVFYELGVRHAALPRTTMAIRAQGQRIPFDVRYLKALTYDLGPGNRFGSAEAATLRSAIRGEIEALRQAAVRDAPVDSPVFQLLDEWRPAALGEASAQTFEDHMRREADLQQRARIARSKDREAGLQDLDRIEAELGHLDVEGVEIILTLLKAYRHFADWPRMIRLYERMPREVQRQVVPREQYAFALNRRAGTTEAQPGDRERAVEVLRDLEKEHGPSPETCGLLGRVFKDSWEERRDADPLRARADLERAIEAYRRGFEADMRDTYPGINAATLLEVAGDERSLEERDRLLPVLRYAADVGLRDSEPDYWSHATMLELSVLAGDAERARESLVRAAGLVRSPWEAETTVRNLRLILGARRARGEAVDLIEDLVEALQARAR